MPLYEIVASILERTSRLLLLGLLLGIGYFVFTTLYCLFLHPLLSIPGPLLARISRLWTRIGNYNRRKSHRIHDAHQQYGKIVRIAPNELSFSDPAAVREIYTSDAFAKEETFYRAKRVFHETILMSFRGQDAHKQRRKLLSRDFSQTCMLDFQGHMTSKIQTLMDQWSRLSADGTAC